MTDAARALAGVPDADPVRDPVRDPNRGSVRSRIRARILTVAFLTVVWVLLWGDVSAANVLGGVAVSAVLIAVTPDRRPARPGLGRFRPLAIARLFGFIAVQLVVSNAVVFRVILRRQTEVRSAVVACRLHTDSEPVVTFVANVLSLSPGTIPVELRRDPPVILVHVLDLRHPADIRRSVAHLERLASEAFGTRSADRRGRG